MENAFLTRKGFKIFGMLYFGDVFLFLESENKFNKWNFWERELEKFILVEIVGLMKH